MLTASPPKDPAADEERCSRCLSSERARTRASSVFVGLRHRLWVSWRARGTNSRWNHSLRFAPAHVEPLDHGRKDICGAAGSVPDATHCGVEIVG